MSTLTCGCRILSRSPSRSSPSLVVPAASSSRSFHPFASTSSLDNSTRPSPPPRSRPSLPSTSRLTNIKPVERWPGWTPVIGLELHVQLKGNLKLLSSALAMYDDFPNSHVAAFDAALPGALPKLEKEAVHLAILACLALKSNINPASSFDRKHYFYPDLPSGFQVTQKYSPLASGGTVRIRQDINGQAHSFQVRIDQIQLEQDTAKSFHDPESGTTFIDLNRAGAALIEIVTQPDMRTPEEAAAFVRQLQSVLRHVGASNANMERGELRCDVNVSVHRSNQHEFGARCEVKNLNGIRFLMGAIESEIQRQIITLEAGEIVHQATRGFDAVTGQTFHLRSKEDAPDYRYMPDPELGSINISEDQLVYLETTLPELPDDAFDRLQTQYGLSPRDAGVLVALGEGGDEETSGAAGAGVHFFETVAEGREAKLAVNWVIHELLGQLAKAEVGFGKSVVEAQDLGYLIDCVASGKVTGTVAKTLLSQFISSPTTESLPSLLKSQIGSAPSSQDITSLCHLVIQELPEEAGKVRAGQEKVLMRLVGEVMKRSKGKADAIKVAGILGNALT